MNSKAADVFCRNRFGDVAVGMGFERGLVADFATGWTMEDVRHMEEVERRVMDEEVTDDGMRCRKGREHADGSKYRENPPRAAHGEGSRRETRSANRATRSTWQESSRQHAKNREPAQCRCTRVE